MLFKQKVAIYLTALLILSGCAAKKEPGAAPLTVFAAASLTDAFTEIGAQFEAAHPGMHITFNFAGSQQLAQQLGQGAPGDVFASANPKQMTAVSENGRISPTAPQTFTHNQLIVIFPADNPGKIDTLADLTHPGLKLILATAEVPVGTYSLAFLQAASHADGLGNGFATDVLANVVSFEQNVRAVFSKVALGEADGGIVYASDVVSMDDGRIGQLTIPPKWNATADYLIAPLNNSPHPELAQQFIDFVLSETGQKILQTYGFQAQ